MVNKVQISPNEVRGYGDIVSPKTLDDFTLYNSGLTLSEGVYTLSYNGAQFILTVNKSRVAPGETITVTVTLTDENGDPVENADIALCMITEDS